MSEMVDRVAAALFEVEFGKDTTGWMEKADFRESYRRQARIAIEAMREPTGGMDDAGRDISGAGYPYSPLPIAPLGYLQTTLIWRAMIDAALK